MASARYAAPAWVERLVLAAGLQPRAVLASSLLLPCLHPSPHLFAIADALPPSRYLFGYGLGVFPQLGYGKLLPQTDILLAVDSPGDWHLRNLRQNPHHYSFARHLGAGAIAAIGSTGAGVYFNPYASIGDSVVKYGVVSTARLVQDLLEWDTFYLAGRLHKPTATVVNDKGIRTAVEFSNLLAVHLALLLLPERFSARDLFSTIAGISYMGDPRVRLGGENPHKVRNIVDAQIDRFAEVYRGALAACEPLVHHSGDHFVQTTDPASRTYLLQLLPLAFRRRVFARAAKTILPDTYTRAVLAPASTPALLHALALDVESKATAAMATHAKMRLWVRGAVVETVGWPAAVQMVKGVVSAGPVRSVKYAWEKRKKYVEAKGG